MEARGMKRKRFTELKNELSFELHKLTNASGDFNNDLHTANKDFEGMLKTISDKQIDFLSRSMVLDEQYSEAIAILKGGRQGTTGEGSGENVELPRAYAEDVRKFASDVKTSLRGHAEFFNEEIEEMENLMKKYDQQCSNNLKELKKRAETLETQREELGNKLTQFISIVEESEDEEDEGQEDDVSEESTEEA